MLPSHVIREIGRKGSDKEQIASKLAPDPGSALELLLDGLNADKADIRFGCSKVLCLISEKNPAALYPRMDFFIGLLEHKNTFLRLDAARIIANLAAVDHEGRFDRIFDRFFAPIPGPSLIPAATAIAAGAKIARARPEVAGRIVGEILKVADAKYATAECRNVALGQAINSFELMYDLIEDKAPVARLVRKQLKNRRPSTRRKAELFIRRHNV